MSGKIATEKELFTLGGGKETDKPTNYDINRCVTKTRSTAFKSITANLTAYQDLQLIPVNLFGKVTMADTIQIEIEKNAENSLSNIDFNIVLLVDGKEFHYFDFYDKEVNHNTIFKTYEWTYNNYFVTKTVNDDKKHATLNINLNKVKELMSKHNNATIQFKVKNSEKFSMVGAFNYTVKLLANREEKYKITNTQLSNSFNYFNVDVFFDDIFNITYDRKNDLITLINNTEEIKDTKFEYDLIIKKNNQIIMNKHILTYTYESILDLNTKNFRKTDIITFEVMNFKIKLIMRNGTEKTITPIFPQNITSIRTISTKHWCEFRLIRYDVDHYTIEVEFLEPNPDIINGSINISNTFTICNFNYFQHAFLINISEQIINIDNSHNNSRYVYHEKRDNIVLPTYEYLV